MGNSPKFDQGAFAAQAGGELLKLIVTLVFMSLEKQGLDTPEKQAAWMLDQAQAYRTEKGLLRDAMAVLEKY